MKTSAQGVANKLIELANGEICQLKLMKMIYLVHGFSLAVNSKGVLNPNYDKIEAWRFGPVVPSVYHETKHFYKSNLEDFRLKVTDSNYELKEATLKDSEIISACNFVWKAFSQFSASELVDITHKEGSPWEKVWNSGKGKNKEIHDKDIKKYFTEWAVIISGSSSSENVNS